MYEKIVYGKSNKAINNVSIILKLQKLIWKLAYGSLISFFIKRKQLRQRTDWILTLLITMSKYTIHLIILKNYKWTTTKKKKIPILNQKLSFLTQNKFRVMSEFFNKMKK